MKILVANPGTTSPLDALEKISSVNRKNGPFDVNILIGKASLNVDFEENTKEFKPTIYISLAKVDTIDNDGTDIKSFSGYGIYKMSNGLIIGYISCNKERLRDERKDIIEYFTASKEFIDILITDIGAKAISLFTGMKTPGNSIIDDIVKEKRPQYHITSSMDKCYIDLQPFTWGDKSVDSQITRYYNLPSYKPDSKEKWILAFKIDVGRNFNDLVGNDFNLGSNPYAVEIKKRKTTETNLSKTKRTKTVDTSTCHFCLGNPNVEDHMIISIANAAYLTVAKGPLTVARGDMNFSGHSLIMPLDHVAKVVKNTNNAAYNEIQKFEVGIVKMNYCSFDMSTVSFEIQSSKSIHYHKQVIPVPKYLISKFETALDRQVHINDERGNGKLNFKKFEKPSSEDLLRFLQDQEANYLQFTVYETDNQDPTIYISTFDILQRLDLQFGRRTLAFVLNLPKRVLWDSPICKQSKETELKEAQLFQRAFKKFDFTD